MINRTYITYIFESIYFKNIIINLFNHFFLLYEMLSQLFKHFILQLYFIFNFFFFFIFIRKFRLVFVIAYLYNTVVCRFFYWIHLFQWFLRNMHFSAFILDWWLLAIEIINFLIFIGNVIEICCFTDSLL